MKSMLSFAAAVCFQLYFSQASGNVNYRSLFQYNSINILTPEPVTNENSISIKGLANIKADQYVALFSVTQTGENAEEVNRLIDQRINAALQEIRMDKTVSVYVDMVSFVPVYQLNAEKKTFSRKTYNEVPAGFELKKNIHLKFNDPSRLNDLISGFSKSEIYDLIRVDYFSTGMENIRKQMMDKARILMQEKVKNMEAVSGESFAMAEKNVTDGYKTVLPVEMYRSYEAYNNSSLSLLKPYAEANQAAKPVTSYYQPVPDKEFDFVLNPVIDEPMIQVMYEIRLQIIRKGKEQEKKPEALSSRYLLVTPSGEVKDLSLMTKP